MRRQPWLGLVLLGAVVGVVFAAISTYDFVQHLDRQVHNLHCSFIPGVSHAGESGCQVAMMSPYSSVFRSHVWGGIPISLGALSVFAFLVFYVLDLMVTRRKDDPRATGFLALATVLPAVASLGMLIVSLTRLGTVCKLCVCIYIASAACLAGALAVWRIAVRERGDVPYEPPPDPDRDERHRGEPAFVGRARGAASSGRLVAVGVTTSATSSGFLAVMFAIGVAFVAIPAALYLAIAPDHARFIGTCEGLPHPDDSYSVMVRIDRDRVRGAPTIEVLDPLCPACRAFEQRLAASGLGDRLDRKAVLFPLDSTCNWMVTEATHPGACTVSEAVLCAGDKAPDVIAWAFDEQDRIRDAARSDPAAAARIVKQRFPDLAACVGSPDARSRLNKSMRWIVANNIRVLTPQVFIDRVKLCDEDVDLGLEYTVSTMLERYAHGGLAPALLEKLPGKRAGDTSPGGSDSTATDRSATDKSATDKSATDKSATEKSATDKSASDKSAADKSAVDKSATEKSATEKSATDKSATDKSATDKAATDKSAADKSATDKSATDKASLDTAPSENGAGTTQGSSEKSSPDKPASDTSGTDKTTDKASGDKASGDKASGDKASGDKAAGDKASTDKPPPRKAPPRRVPPRKPPPEKPSTPPQDQGPVTRPGDVP
jgi:uncharacterized membrane protein